MTADLARVADTDRHQLDVSLVRDSGGRTHIGGQYVAYPFHLCRALRTLGDPPDMPTLYIQSCSGGLFEGDDLHCRISVGRQARAHITTAAATVVHTMEAGSGALHMEIDAAEGAYVEYLPDPLILFPDAALWNSVRIRLAANATVLAWDSFLAHDPKAAGAVFRHLQSEMSIVDSADRLLARDRYCAQGKAFLGGTPGVMGEQRVQAGFVMARRQAPIDEWVPSLRDALAQEDGAYAGVSALPNDAGVWVRILSRDAAQSNALLARAWSRARTLITGSVPSARRK